MLLNRQKTGLLGALGAIFACMILGSSVLISRPVGGVSAASNATIARLPTQNTFIASGRSTQNFSELRNVWIGHNQSIGYGEQRSLFTFDLNEIQPGSQIQSAKLRLYMAATTIGDGPLAVTVRRIASNDWDAQIVTWNTAPNQDGIGPSAITQIGTNLSQWYEWDLKNLLQDWVDNRPTNDGRISLVLLSQGVVGEHERGFRSLNCPDQYCGPQPGTRPRIEVGYELPTPTPTATHTPTPTPTPTPPAVTLRLSNDPIGAIEPGAKITYTIKYSTSSLGVTNVSIYNPIPAHVAVVENSIVGPGSLFSDRVIWYFSTLVANTRGEVSYQVQRPAAPVTPVIIYNSGASAIWEGSANPGSTSNAVYNAHKRWLPVITRCQPTASCP